MVGFYIFVLFLVASSFWLFTHKASMNISVQFFVGVHVFFISWVNMRGEADTVPSHAFPWLFPWPQVLDIFSTLPSGLCPRRNPVQTSEVLCLCGSLLLGTLVALVSPGPCAFPSRNSFRPITGAVVGFTCVPSPRDHFPLLPVTQHLANHLSNICIYIF